MFIYIIFIIYYFTLFIILHVQFHFSSTYKIYLTRDTNLRKVSYNLFYFIM